MPALTFRSCALAALVSGAFACGDLPGEVIGAYNVQMQLEENSCGAGGLPLADGHTYAVELRADGAEGYWRIPKAAPIKGRYQEQDGAFEFSFAMSLELGNADAGTSGCLVRRQELLRGRIEARTQDAGTRDAASSGDAGDGGGDEATMLVGEHRISFTPDPGGRCANVSGPIHVFERLPCSALYRLFGVERKKF